VSWYQISKTNLDFTETTNGSGISWAKCTSASRSRQITMPEPHRSVFTGRMAFLPPNQQRQNTEGKVPNKYENKHMHTLCDSNLAANVQL